MRPLLIAGLLAALGCGDDGGGPPDHVRVHPRIVGVRSSEPQLPGTALVLTVANRDALAAAPRLSFETEGETFDLVPRDPSVDAVWGYELTAAIFESVGEGRHAVTLTLVGETPQGAPLRSDPFDYELELATDIAFTIDGAPSGSVFRNEPAVLSGSGFLEPAEGTMVARFTGDFTPEGGSAAPVSAELAVTQAEPGDRSRGLVVLGTELGGSMPGAFEGTVTLEATLAGRVPMTTEPIATTLRFQPPAIFTLEPAVAPLEHLVLVRGGGFLGGNPDELTLVQLEGTFTDPVGGMQAVDEELVLEWRDGETLIWVLGSQPVGQRLVAELFGDSAGTFEGSMTPVTFAGDTELSGSAAPITLTLSPVTQVVWVRFLPGFYESLPLFGLAAAAGELEERVAERIESIYAPWRVDVRLERPTDVSDAGYATVELGGPDPNGLGLFGYDNSPGKDVGNLRLFDAIGGENAETQEDGFPGYGGVFVESMLMWSSHPEIPTGDVGPNPDPLFDEIFDPVREEPATAAEVAGSGPRAAVVARAVNALAAAIGETTAHELGHSFGLAAPFGASTVFHNAGDREGCLMDSGSARPFGERAAQSGFATSQICGESATYLDGILGEP
ncbi:MAG: hypothetical protein JJ863_28655 [Deltaproteobacteria bacterium]|nr:hypothetical protein [Deltaproteobacteria bacterium]